MIEINIQRVINDKEMHLQAYIYNFLYDLNIFEPKTVKISKDPLNSPNLVETPKPREFSGNC